MRRSFIAKSVFIRDSRIENYYLYMAGISAYLYGPAGGGPTGLFPQAGQFVSLLRAVIITQVFRPLLRKYSEIL